MLAEIVVENFALIEHLQMEFHAGLNIITGETGAGKSLLTDAVGLLLGGKGDRDMIRYGTGKALIEGVFSGPFSDAATVFCDENGIDAETIVIRREMNSEGRNIVRVNGHRVNLSLLEQLAPKLMNIHSQTEHFSLFREEEQLLLLDRFGGGELLAQKEKTAAAYGQWQEKKKARAVLGQRIADKESRLDYLLYQKKEIEGFRLVSGEDETLREEIRLLSTSSSRYDEAQTVYAALNGGESGGAVAEVFDAVNALRRIAEKDPALTSLAETLNDAYYTLEDIRTEILSYRDGIEVDPVRLEEAETRLSEIKRAEKKYRKDIDGILSYLDEIQEEISAYEDSDELLARAAADEKKALADYEDAAAALTALRKTAGKELSAAIEKQLAEMKLPDARFAVAVAEATPSPEGRDAVTYMATMNKGEELRPLAKVASGGEISRVLLATKIILGRIDAVQTMIFDEIDSGLGGETASRVGEKMKLLAAETQVFAVTHSPLVAVYADHHYFIRKKESERRIVVSLKELDQEGRRREIARMLSGDENSEISLRQADSLIEAANGE
ncbi:MAG: DNA repair protein RecN [Bacillota bacterium]|jgi:DNA repair protein RecN (Recombination protein N)